MINLQEITYWSFIDKNLTKCLGVCLSTLAISTQQSIDYKVKICSWRTLKENSFWFEHLDDGTVSK